MMTVGSLALSMLLFLLFGIGLERSTAQHDLPADLETEFYYRLLQLNGLAESSSFSLRPMQVDSVVETGHPWERSYHLNVEPVANLPGRGGVFLYSPTWFQSYNSTLPRGRNDGALWQGKGYNSGLSFGLYVKSGPLHLNFRPFFSFSQNAAFDLGPYPVLTRRFTNERLPLNQFAYRHSGKIDYAQRFGDSSYSSFDWGESSIELRKWGLRLALANRRVWIGPGINTAMQFGYNAPGFRHLYAGTSKPLVTPVGSFEFAYIFGGVEKSDYYAEQAEKMNSVNAATFIFSPWFDRNLSLGVMRIFYHNYPKSFSEYADQVTKLVGPGVKTPLQTESNPNVVNPDNQVFSLFFRYFFPNSGFEFYGEYGRNDANVDTRDLRLQPDHFRAYTLGGLKSFELNRNRLLSLGIELAQLETTRSSLLRGGGALIGWYTHFAQIPSSTNRGQIMGSGLGPSGNLQMVYASIYDPRGKIGLNLERWVHNNSAVDEYFFRYQEANDESINRWEIRNIEYTLGLQATAFLPRGFELSLQLDQSFIMNHHYLKENDIWNTRVGLQLRKQGLNWLR